MGKAFDFTPACLSFPSLWSFTLIFSPLSFVTETFSCLTLRWKNRKRRTKIRVEPVHLVSLLNYTVSCSCFFSCSFIVFGLFTQPGKEQSDEKERRKKCEGETLWRPQRMERNWTMHKKRGGEEANNEVTIDACLFVFNTFFSPFTVLRLDIDADIESVRVTTCLCVVLFLKTFRARRTERKNLLSLLLLCSLLSWVTSSPLLLQVFLLFLYRRDLPVGQNWSLQETLGTKRGTRKADIPFSLPSLTEPRPRVSWSLTNIFISSFSNLISKSSIDLCIVIFRREITRNCK